LQRYLDGIGDHSNWGVSFVVVAVVEF
jgi:hypothetical protein